MNDYINMRFRVSGGVVPVDHGIRLHGAIAKEVPGFHDDNSVLLRRINGVYAPGTGLLKLSPQCHFVVRVPMSDGEKYEDLAGAALQLGTFDIRVGYYDVDAVLPEETLYSDLVTTRNGQEQGRFLRQIKKEMARKGIRGDVRVVKRKIYTVKERKFVGFSMFISGLSEESSLILQTTGLGGRRKMGAGFFERYWG